MGRRSLACRIATHDVSHHHVIAGHDGPDLLPPRVAPGRCFNDVDLNLRCDITLELTRRFGQ